MVQRQQSSDSNIAKKDKHKDAFIGEISVRTKINST